jgi:sensor histidine kinase YesM
MGPENNGLINTYSRLFIEYGGRVALSMDNHPSGGCTVTIEVRGGGESHDVPADAGGG